MKWLGRRISGSRQHQLAFVTILLLIVGIFPQLQLPMVAPGVIISLGMMLLVLHLSAYYSGTSKNSAHVYAVILFLTALILTQLTYPIFQRLVFGRFLIMGGIWLLLLEVERIVSVESYKHSRVEQSFLWLWFISSGLSLIETQIQILPDCLFLILIFTHLEKRWPRQSIPAPIITLYGILFMWLSHNLMLTISDQISTHGVESLVPNSQMVLTTLLVMGILFYSYKSQSLAKKYLYLFIAQEILILGLRIENMFVPTQELIGLLRLVLFIALIGLFVMIESREGQGLDPKLLRGLRFERPRFTLGLMVIATFLVLHPLIYIQSSFLYAKVLLGLLVFVGIAWVIGLYRISAQQPDRNYRILRPSVSIWSTVVFTILWAAVTLIEMLVRDYLS